MMKKVIISLTAFVLWFAGFAQQTVSLSKQEEAGIVYMREEEKLARDVYEFLYARWNINPFGNIRRSEQVHMGKMKALIAAYKLEDPVEKSSDKQGVFVDTVLQKYYNELTIAGSTSLVEALKAGAKVEELDIADLEERVRQASQADIVNTYNYLRMASENHLRAFANRLKMQGVDYEPVILSKETFNKIIGRAN